MHLTVFVFGRGNELGKRPGSQTWPVDEEEGKNRARYVYTYCKGRL